MEMTKWPPFFRKYCELSDARLIRLRHIGEHRVDHADHHAVLVRMAGIFDDRDDVGALLRQIATGPAAELDRIDETLGTDNVGHMRNGGAGRSAEIQHLGAGRHVDVVDAAQNGSSQLRAERIPHTVLDLLAVGLRENTA